MLTYQHYWWLCLKHTRQILSEENNPLIPPLDIVQRHIPVNNRVSLGHDQAPSKIPHNIAIYWKWQQLMNNQFNQDSWSNWGLFFQAYGKCLSTLTETKHSKIHNFLSRKYLIETILSLPVLHPLGPRQNLFFCVWSVNSEHCCWPICPLLKQRLTYLF